MRDFLAEVRHCIRSLWAKPTFTAAVVATLAVGISTTAAVFSFVNAVVLRPLPYPDSGRLATICEQYPGSSPDWCSISPPNVEDIRARARTLEAIGIGRTWSYHLTTPTGQESMSGAIVTPGALAALGARPVRGRLLEETDLIGQPSTVAMLSHESWQQRFGGAADIIGRTLVLDDRAVTIVGVMEPGFLLPKFDAVELWRPIHLMPNDEEARDWPGFVAYGLLRDGASLDDARREVAAIAATLRKTHFAAKERWGLSVQSMQDLVVGSVKPTMYALLAGAVVILLIGCANVANLLLVRASARRRELAVRTALGATRARVARTVILESALIGIAGTAVGLLGAHALSGMFRSLAPAGIPRLETVGIDRPVIAFAMIVGIGASLLMGLVPAMRAGRGDLAESLREGGRSVSRQVGRVGPALVVGELALAVMLVTASGLLIRTFAAYSGWTPGFDPARLLVFSLSAPQASYPGGEQVAGLWTRVEDELRTLPGVEAVATASAGPLFGGDGAAAIELEGRATPIGASARWFDVSPGWFTTLGIPIVHGRDFQATDRPNGPRVALVNETFAEQYWSGSDAVGKRFTMTSHGMTLEVIGVVRDVPPLKPGGLPVPEVYWSNRQLPRPYTYVVVRSSVPPASLAAPVRVRLTTIDDDLTPGTLRPYSEVVGRQLARPRFTMLLLGSFGLAALLLSAIGVYGLLAYVVSLRSREIAIRLAIGARRGQVLRGIIASGFRLTLIGGAIGVLASLAMGRAISTMVAGVSARDPTTFIAAVALLVGVALIACAVPAHRASGVNPVSALSAD